MAETRHKHLTNLTPSSLTQRPVVVLVHGLWMTGVDMMLLRFRLRQQGFVVKQFSYRPVRCDLLQNAVRLNRFLLKIQADTIHLVGHSLGGLLIRSLLYNFPHQRSGRVVTLGTPHQGSHVARFFSHHNPLKHLLGKSIPALAGGVPSWNGERELGSVAGSLAVGVGRVLRDLPVPNDGTVAVHETELDLMSDHLTLPVSHMGMLVSARVAAQTGYFLHHGHFRKDSEK